MLTEGQKKKGAGDTDSPHQVGNERSPGILNSTRPLIRKHGDRVNWLVESYISD